MGKVTAAEIKDLKAALKALQDLQTQLGQSNSATNHMQGVSPIAASLGGMIDNTGTHVSKYVDARTTAISTGLTNATMGVSTAVMLLTNTIQNYETNEKTHTDNANATGNGGGGSSSGSGSDGGGRGKGGS